MTLAEAYRTACGILAESGVPDAEWDAHLLLEHAAGVSRAQFFAGQDRSLPEDKAEGFLELVRKRAQRIPLQQLTGEQEFCRIPFLVTDAVLCPRQETELLAELAFEKIREVKERAEKDKDGRTADGVSVLDLCTGSGCILISLLAEFPELTGTGSDLSADALEVAKKNAERTGVSERCSFVRSDLFEKTEGTFDLIVTNPPYIRSGDIPGLMAEVRDHEPRMALDGGTDGLDFYRRITEGAAAHLKEGGWLLAEIGFDQGEAVRSMFVEHQYKETQIRKDLSGLDRVVLGRLRSV